MARVSKWLKALSALATALAWSASATAGPRDIRLLPAVIDDVPAETPVDLTHMARELDQILREAVQDFGLAPLAASSVPANHDEGTLSGLAADSWLLAARLALDGGALRLRLVAMAPSSRLLLVRVERFEPSQLEVRTLGMLRELLGATAGDPPRDCPPAPALAALPAGNGPAMRSEGRAVLALHTAALGGYLGYGLQRASGSNDARLTYPLAALGAGVGVGAAMIVSDEWDIDVADAWFLGAGMFWPTVSTLLILDADDANTPGRRQMLGLAGAVGGVTLATAGLVLGDVSEGGAALTHSGAGLGLLVGGLTEMTIEGDAEATPRSGAGWGALAGLLVAGAAATSLDVPSATDVLFIDLSALLGGLLGAALGTPVLVSQDQSPTRDRIWLAGILAGTLGGAGISYWVTQSDASTPAVDSTLPTGFRVAPRLGWMGNPLGLGVVGQW